MISLDIINKPKYQSNRIKVLGVGGAGGNAVNYMHKLGIKDVDFAVCNTDLQALDSSIVENKIQIGVKTTGGLGAGTDPKIGLESAEENISEVEKFLGSNTEMLFLTCGMGGGTGTGAIPVIAKKAKEKGILTVGIVTLPVNWEGKQRELYSKQGLENLVPNVDSYIVIDQNKLYEIHKELGKRHIFAKADDILYNSAKGIAEMVTKKLYVNADLNDIKKALKSSKETLIGRGFSKDGENRAIKSVKQAVNNPLLRKVDIMGASRALISITYNPDKEMTGVEQETVMKYIVETSQNPELDIIKVSEGEDEGLEEGEMSITIIATDFGDNNFTESILDKNQEIEFINTEGESNIVNFGIENQKEGEAIIYNLDTGKKNFVSKSKFKELTKE